MAATDTSKRFSPSNLIQHLEAIHPYSQDIPGRDFVDVCWEICKIVFTLGSALKIASDDVSEKSTILTERLDELAKRAEKEGQTDPIKDDEKQDPPTDKIRMTLQFLIKDEMARDVHKINKKSFASGSRTILRLMWFLDFVGIFLEELYKNPTKKLRENAATAYEHGLAPHHPWVLRKTIGAALYTLPAREDFLKRLSDNDEATIMDEMRRVVSLLTPVRESLWKFYKENDLEKLP